MKDLKKFYRKDIASDSRIDDTLNREERENLDYIQEHLPTPCKGCSFLIVVNSSKHIVRCPYLVKNWCLVK